MNAEDAMMGRTVMTDKEKAQCIIASMVRTECGCDGCIALQDLLAPIAAGTHVIVPVEPTDEMLSAMARSNEDFLSDKGPYPRSRRVYRSMLKAAKDLLELEEEA